MSCISPTYRYKYLSKPVATTAKHRILDTPRVYVDSILVLLNISALLPSPII